MAKSFKTLARIPLSLVIICLSCSGFVHASNGVQSRSIGIAVSAEDQKVVDSYKDLCLKIQSGLGDLARDIDKASVIEANAGHTSKNGELFSGLHKDMSRTLSTACNKTENLNVLLGEFGESVASFGRTLAKMFSDQPNRSDVDRSLMSAYRDMAVRLSGINGDIEKLLTIGIDYLLLINE